MIRNMFVVPRSLLSPGARRSLTAQHGAAIVSLLVATGVVAAIVLTLFFVFGKIVPPGYIGVRQNYFGVWGIVEKGIARHGLHPGLHWRILGVSEINLIPSGFQVINFNQKEIDGELNHAVLELQTSDGPSINTDVTLIIRYFDAPSKMPSTPQDISNTEPNALLDPAQADEKSVPFASYHEQPHGGPKDLLERYGSVHRTQLERFSREAENELRKSLSRLSSTEFYKPKLRETAVLDSHQRMNGLVGPYGIDIWAVLIRRYIYTEQTIDDQIFAKNLQVATEGLNAAASRREDARARTAREAALGDANIRDLQVKSEAAVQITRSQADRYQATKVADGDLLVVSAKAEIDAAKSAALQEFAGSDVYIAREMAPLLATLRGGIVSGLDPFDINRWMEKLAGKRSHGGGG